MRLALAVGAALALGALAALTAFEREPEPTAPAASGVLQAATRPGARRSAGAPYAPRGLPDRIVLTPSHDPSRALAVSFRTDARQVTAQLELAAALDTPNLAARARRLTGTSRALQSENGLAHFHQVRLDGLTPDTMYAYRVRGADGWSEWLQFRTAAAGFAPFRVLYFGDLQDEILARGARVVRQALHAAGSPALMLHAGDLVSQRADNAHDDEWGQWTAAFGFHLAMVPQLPVAGNHEYVEVLGADGRRESWALGPHWGVQFALPQNGADALTSTTYFVDYQGVRFIALDGRRRASAAPVLRTKRSR